MFCCHCGESVVASSNYCMKCGKELQTNEGLSSHESTKFAKQAPTESEGRFGRVLSFKQYYEKKTGAGRQVVSNKVKKGKTKGTEEKAKVQNLDVTIFIGLQKWSEEDLKLKPTRGKRVALKVSREAPYKVLCEKAVEKWKAYHTNLYDEDENYVLLLDSGQEALFLPGSAKEFFSLHRYQEEVGKDFKRIVLYLCTAKEFHHSECIRLDPDWDDEYGKETNDSASQPTITKFLQEHSIPSKRLKEDCDFNSDMDYWEPTESEDAERQVQNDEKIAIELQRQLVDESDQNSEDKGPFWGEPSNHHEETSGTSTSEDFTSPAAVVQALEKRVNKEDQFFIPVRRKTTLPRILNLWRYEAKRQDVHNTVRVKFLGEDGIDSGALSKEFFTDVVPAIGNTLFPNGSPIDSTYHVQNGNFKTSGEIVASSLANGGPPPCFMDERAFQSLVNPGIDALNMETEDGMTSTERQLLVSVKSDVNQHTDTIFEHGYTGPVDVAHIDDIVRSMTVSLINKRALYLREFKAGLSLFGLSNILDSYPQVCRSLFVQEQNEKVDASYLFSLMQPEFSPDGSSRREVEETLMDNFQDLLMALEDGRITGYTSPVAWNYSEDQSDEIPAADTEPVAEQFEMADLTSSGIMGWLTGQKHRQLNGERITIAAKFDHECLTRNPAHSICFPIVGACGRVITFPVSHMKDYEAFKNVFLLAFCKGQAFAKP